MEALRTYELVRAGAACFTVGLMLAAAGPARAGERPDPGADRAALHVHQQLAVRMPGTPVAERHALAHAILAEARLARIDPLLVVALIHVESTFDPEAESSAGALGLMQLRTPTFRSERARHRLPGDADPRDPVANVQAGTRYLRRLLDAFGDVDVALMAYNAGPNRILGHLRAGEIPERFHQYPRKIRGELDRIRASLRLGAPAQRLARGEPGAPARGVRVAAAD